jgi:hypothetical protein
MFYSNALSPRRRGRVGKASPVYDAPETGARSDLQDHYVSLNMSSYLRVG